MESTAIAIEANDADLFARRLRNARPPTIARIEERSVLLDLRSVQPHEDAALADALAASI